MLRELVFLTACLGFSAAAWGEASAKEAQALSAFENFCLANASYPNVLPELLIAKGATETKQFKADLSATPAVGSSFKALLTPLNGRSFKLKIDMSEYLITITDTGACSLSSRDANGGSVESLFRERMQARQIGKDALGSIMHATYAVSYPAPLGVLHALVFVDRPIRADSTGIRLSSLADLFLRARGQREPEWPNAPLGFDPKAP